jgi:F420-0:gamma-glutamyl ligase-like protein
VKSVKSAMKYERTGTVKSKKVNVEQTIFRDMAVSTMVGALIHECWRRYSTEILAFALFTSWAVYIWAKLG